MEDWSKRPILIDHWDENVDTIMAIDENGTNDLIGIQKKIKKDYIRALIDRDSVALPHDRWFTITGVIMERDYFPTFKDNINTIKYSYWDEGKFNYKKGQRRVVFHSRDIRKKEGPFNPKFIQYEDFLNDITNLVNNTDFTILSSSIDKVKHVLNYTNPFPVYDLCLDFIVERYCRHLNRENKTGLLLLESRGKKEDRRILKHLVNLMENGNNYWDSDHFSCIKGVYFNPKWCFKQNGQASFVLLELADLVSYPIFKYVSRGIEDHAFNALKYKIYNYPSFDGYGLKVFPRK